MFDVDNRICKADDRINRQITDADPANDPPHCEKDKETADKAVEASKQAQAESSDSKSSGKKEKKKKANTECLEKGLLN